MRLVGASNWVIQLPFMLEGTIAAALGALLAIGGLLVLTRVLITDWLQQSVDWIAYVGTSDVMVIAPLLTAVAVLIAFVSALATVRRHAQV